MKLEGWKETLISKAGKEILIKSVVQAIPQYAMSIFKIPTSICKSMERKIASFWWSNSESKTGQHWKRWDILKTRKDKGGLGFKDLMDFNKAMLGKQAWRIAQNRVHMWSRLLKGLYYPDKSFFHAKKGSRPSWGWQSILYGREAISGSVSWSIGNGETVNIREDPWLKRGIIGGPANVNDPSFVADLILKQNAMWDESTLRRVFDEELVKEISSIPLNLPLGKDKLIWTGKQSGDYTIKNGYNVIRDKVPPTFL
ncbi:uncharacterized mitochondrial protein AtMg00310-like [Rhodamnia argentea]|uniref:Uncharacterized mitochondrial protein AtMg00310-like n=1 Tax=Rhodamnia argentea TaxID=178133 RepID=A0ABM3HPN0_9MYRT|nr:uncharacterized mitochondrial protein AtMg00310-like [Rhodamnia argentea]